MQIFNSRITVAIVSVLLTAVAAVIYVNLAGGERTLKQQLPRLYESDDAEFRRALSALLGPAMVEGNAIQTLRNGDQIFPAMLQAIRGAQRTITFETYIYWSGEIGKAFVDALNERAQAGVAVHVLLDWVGSMKIDDAMLKRMRQAGVEVERFHKPGWTGLGKLNNRTHRKLLICDGKVGFTGGVGIADLWRGNARTENEWRDNHFRVEGPVVSQMQSVFLDNWMRATGKVLHGDAYFPEQKSAGKCLAQMFSSSPQGGSESMHLMYLLAITAAHQSIDLANAYFVPDAMAIKALTDAARRGVKVRVLTPSTVVDSELVRQASHDTWGELLEAGVQIAEYQPTMLHVKGLVVDGMFSSVGSTNFDGRSFRLNDEANLNVLNSEFGAKQREVFQADWDKARQFTLAQWQNRPWTERVLEKLAALLRNQL